MELKENQVIGELVANDYRTASVFKKYGIDFCCQGNRTINEACEKKKIDPTIVIGDLQKMIVTKQETVVADYESWPMDLLTDYIEKKHHRYVENAIAEILPYLDKICKVHGEYHPELQEINQHFTASARELGMHMKKEELLLFPFIRKMVKTNQDGIKNATPPFETVKNPIQSMMQEHTTEGERFGKIAELSNNFTPPEDACNTFRVTYAMLKEFEEDLHLHIHLENNILFPKSIELEKEIMQ